jgi:hypothetical protein
MALVKKCKHCDMLRLFSLAIFRGWGRYSSVGIATTLRTGRSGDRSQVAERFSTPVQTGPGAHPPSYTMGTGSFRGVKRPGRVVDHTPPSSDEVKERVELCLYYPLGLRGLL